MGLAGVSIWQLLIVFAIVALLFGTKKLRHLGRDLGEAVSSFRKAYNGNTLAEKDKTLDDSKLHKKHATAAAATNDNAILPSKFNKDKDKQ